MVDGPEEATEGASAADAPAESPPAAGAETPPLTIPAFDAALDEDRVTVQDVGNAWHYSLEAFTKDPAERELMRLYFDRLVQHCLKKDSGFRFGFWDDGSGVTLYQDELVIHRNPRPGRSLAGRVDEILFQFDRLAGSAREFIEGKQLRNCLNMIHDVVSLCFEVLNDARSNAQKAGRLEEVLEFIESEIPRVKQYFRQAAMRRAQVHYAKGMLAGAALLYAAAGLVWAAASGFGLTDELHQLPLALGVVVAGCTGAVVSVMQRMTRATLRIDYTMGSTVGTLGSFRPVIGAILATAIFFMIRGGLVPHLEPPPGQAGAYFFLAVAFITGFSERLAQDMLATTAKRLGGAPDDPAGNGPEDGAEPAPAKPPPAEPGAAKPGPAEREPTGG